MEFGDLIGLDYPNAGSGEADLSWLTGTSGAPDYSMYNFGNQGDTGTSAFVDTGANLGNQTLQGDNFGLNYGNNPSISSTPSAGSQGNWLQQAGNMMGISPENQRLIGQLLPLLVGAGTSAGAALLGGQQGAQAGRAASNEITRGTERIAQPTAQEQNIMNMGEQSLMANSPQSRSFGAIQGDVRSQLLPFIESLLQQEGQQQRRQTEGLVARGMQYGGVLPQQRAYLQAQTNNQIGQLGANAVNSERALRSQEATNMLRTVMDAAGRQQGQRQQTLMTGQQQATAAGTQAAATAGRAPMDAATLAAMIAAIFGNQTPNLGGTR